jgi:hypothetical protein
MKRRSLSGLRLAQCDEPLSTPVFFAGISVLCSGGSGERLVRPGTGRIHVATHATVPVDHDRDPDWGEQRRCDPALCLAGGFHGVGFSHLVRNVTRGIKLGYWPAGVPVYVARFWFCIGRQRLARDGHHL